MIQTCLLCNESFEHYEMIFCPICDKIYCFECFHDDERKHKENNIKNNIKNKEEDETIEILFDKMLNIRKRIYKKFNYEYNRKHIEVIETKWLIYNNRLYTNYDENYSYVWEANGEAIKFKGECENFKLIVTDYSMYLLNIKDEITYQQHIENKFERYKKNQIKECEEKIKKYEIEIKKLKESIEEK